LDGNQTGKELYRGWVLRFLAWLLVFVNTIAFADKIVEPPRPSDFSYTREIEGWRADRVARLKSDTGWLTLVGLFWLKPGENKFGSDSTNQIVLEGQQVPKEAGSFWLEPNGVRLEVRPGVNIFNQGKPVTTAMPLHADSDQDPTVLNLGSLSFYVVKRVDRFAIRVKDKQSPALKHFGGLSYFPIDAKWKVQAKFEKYNPAKKIPIVNVLGMVDDEDSPGAVVFERKGKIYRLDAIQQEPQSLFMIFADETSGKETYGAGRYLEIPLPDAQGRVVIDFNKSYNPPCSFTSYATCPLPPPQNKLNVRIDAGEKKYKSKPD
jgi:uncharacterized protein